jgi:hypothetical protein
MLDTTGQFRKQSCKSTTKKVSKELQAKIEGRHLERRKVKSYP